MSDNDSGRESHTQSKWDGPFGRRDDGIILPLLAWLCFRFVFLEGFLLLLTGVFLVFHKEIRFPLPRILAWSVAPILPLFGIDAYKTSVLKQEDKYTFCGLLMFLGLLYVALAALVLFALETFLRGGFNQ